MEVNGVQTMKDRQRDYMSYLLRMWRTGSEEDGAWLASLTNPFTGEQLGFATLNELFTFLQSRVDDPKPSRLEADLDGSVR